MKYTTAACAAMSLAALPFSNAAEYDTSGVDFSNPDLYKGIDWSDKSMYDKPFFQAFVGPPILSGRYDPIMAPGKAESAHVHDIFGGGGFSVNWKYSDAVGSGCTNVAKQDDFSNYWFPALYHQDDSGAFTKVKSELRLYYNWGGRRTMWPEGFKLVAGNALTRTDDSATNPFTKSLTWNCAGTLTKTAALPPNIGSCGDLITKVHFPSCMKQGATAEGFSTDDPMGQVAYPTDGVQGSTCPPGYVLTPEIMFEVFFHGTNTYSGGKFVFAHGDTTGFGFHGDFINGWKSGQGSLEPAITSGCKEGFGGNICVTAGHSGDGKCTITPTNNENAQNPGNALLGCNPVYPATAACQPKGGASTQGNTTTVPEPVMSATSSNNIKREVEEPESKIHLAHGYMRRHLGIHRSRHAK